MVLYKLLVSRWQEEDFDVQKSLIPSGTDKLQQMDWDSSSEVRWVVFVSGLLISVLPIRLPHYYVFGR
jgi:hypothetical protein